MQTRIHPDLFHLPEVREADSILRRCVHCGFCTATCPTYQLLGDDLDSPRGRIYLIKNLLEDNAIDDKSAQHIDRCLSCRSCETTCPSGVQYARLLEIGKGLVATRHTQSISRRLKSQLSRWIIPRNYLFKPLVKTGQLFRPVLPKSLAGKVPQKQKISSPSRLEIQAPEKRVLLLQGCAQRAATPNVNVALEQLLRTKNISVSMMPDEGCCGALEYHLSAHRDGLQRMRDLTDKLHERLQDVDYIVSSASGCGVTIKEYPLYFSGDSEYKIKANEIIKKVVDVSEIMGQYRFSCAPIHAVVHTPCTLQHGQGINGEIERILESAGITLVKCRESHLCCGSAGTYSIMQPDLSQKLLSRKLAVLQKNAPEVIVTANVGCQLHLQSGADIPVMHWVELLHKQHAIHTGMTTV
jgi:glycolate oxidase iron-sulfur subunit